MRLIDADEFGSCVGEVIRCAMCKNGMRSDRGCDGGCRYDVAMYKEICGHVYSLVENCMVADTEQIRHGKWNKRSNNPWGDIDGYQCSECGEDCAFPDWVEDESDEDMCLTMMKYCYNCGARMDGDE